MPLRDLILEISTLWPAYRRLKIVTKTNVEYQKVCSEFPDLLRDALRNNSNYEFEGSTGRGNITAAPWIAILDRRITTSATRGFYLVYLYSVDLHRLCLSLAFGTTQFSELFPKTSERHKRLRTAAEALRPLLGETRRNLNFGPLNLAATSRDRLHSDYERSNIAAIEYSLDALPAEKQLIDDVRHMVTLYQNLVDDPLRPSLDEIVDTSITTPVDQDRPNVSDFVPRAKKLPGSGKGAGGRSSLPHQSKKIGDIGEDIVFKEEVRRMRDLGRDPELVKWVSREGKTPGWDITSQDDTGDPIHIEVKSSVTKKLSCIVMTANEWNAAKEHKDRYFVYLVTRVQERKPGIERLCNPALLAKEGKIAIEVAAFAVSLSSAETGNAV